MRLFIIHLKFKPPLKLKNHKSDTMKTNLLKISVVILFSLGLVLGCDLIPIPGLLEKTLTADEAKVEIRSANQDIVANKDAMMSTSGMEALMYLMNLMTDGMEKSAMVKRPVFASHISYSKVLNYFRKSNLLKSATLDDDSNYGILEYDFASATFVMVEESSTMLQIRYPADDVAMANQVNNAEFTMNNLEFDEISSTEEYWDYQAGGYVTMETTEEIPVKAKVTLDIDGSEELSASYKASYNNDGLPTSMDMSFETDDYSLSMSFSGGGVDYRSKMEYKLKSDVIIAYDYDIKYTSDQTSVEKLAGYVQLTPLKFKGIINSDAIETYMMELDENGGEVDLDYLNSQIDMQVYQSDMNSKIGDLEYKMYYDPEWGEEYPEVAVVYEDGSYDWLSDIMTFAEI